MTAHWPSTRKGSGSRLAYEVDLLHLDQPVDGISGKTLTGNPSDPVEETRRLPSSVPPTPKRHALAPPCPKPRARNDKKKDSRPPHLAKSACVLVSFLEMTGVTRVMPVCNAAVRLRKSGWRLAARREWGAKWWDVHPLIKRARIHWALEHADVFEGGHFRKAADALEKEGAKKNGRVKVTEADGKTYTV